MKDDYLISIIVPVYNSVTNLKKCLNSVVNQTYENIEIVIVNDGSTDDSQSIIQEYVNLFPSKIHSFQIPHSGVANARNFGIEKVTGDYFLFVDSDDYIELDLIENLVKNLTKNSLKIDIIKYKMQIISEQFIKIDGPVFGITNGENAFSNLCFKDKMIDTPCLYLFRTEFYKKHNFKFLSNTYHEDFGLLPLIIVQASNILSVDIYGYNYVQSNESIVRNSDYEKTLKKSTDLLIHYDNMIEKIKKIKLNSQTVRNLKQYYSNSVILGAEKLNKKDRKNYIKQIKNRKLVKNIKASNVRQVLKKIILNIDIRLYLFLNKYI